MLGQELRFVLLTARSRDGQVCWTSRRPSRRPPKENQALEVASKTGPTSPCSWEEPVHEASSHWNRRLPRGTGGRHGDASRRTTDRPAQGRQGRQPQERPVPARADPGQPVRRISSVLANPPAATRKE